MTEPTAGSDSAGATATPAAPAPAAPTGGIVNSGAPPAAPEAAAPAPAPEAAAPAVENNWRDRVAAGDQTFLKTLSRYTDEASYYRALRILQDKVATGELKGPPPPFPEKGTPEEQAAWRTAQGIPADPKEYKIEMPEGVVLGESDKPGVERLTAFAHKNNWSPSQLNAVMAAYQNEMDAVKASREEADAQYHQESDDSLRTEWKGDYRANLQAIQNMLETAPKEVSDRLLGGRTADGKKIADDPAILKWLASTARDLNPAATLLPAGTQNMQGVGTELDAMKKLVADRSSEYYRGPNADKLQTRYRELLDAQARMKTRAA